MGEPATRVIGVDPAGSPGHTPGVTVADDALSRFFSHYYARRPVQATFTGVHDFDGRLPDWSPESLDALVAEMQSLRRDLATAGLVEDSAVRRFPEDVDLALADAFLEIQIAEHQSGHFLHRNPSLWTGEAIFSVIALVTRGFAPLQVRLRSAASRLAAMPGFLADARRVLQASPDPWRARAIRECSVAARLFGDRLPRWWNEEAGDVPASQLRDLDIAARAAAGAFTEFAAWLERDLAAPPVARLSAGEPLLSLLLRRGHWCTSPVDGLLEEAQAALDQASVDLDRIASAVAPGGWPDVQELITAQHPTADDYLPRFERIWRACREKAIADDVLTWPDAPLRYLEIPAQTRDAAPHLYYLFYRSPAPFDAVREHDYVVTPVSGEMPAEERARRLRAANDSTITLNHVVHHGALGHHVQNYYAARGASRIGQVAAVDGANRIGMFSGGTLAEGWACYACDLAEEMGFLTARDRAAQQHTRVRLLTRAVADLELHAGRRTLDETAALYRDRAMLAHDAAQAEAVKNSMFPGAAVMYWLGTRDLHALRRECESRDGARFTRKAFHDRVLSYGAIPVPLIARLMTQEGA